MSEEIDTKRMAKRLEAVLTRFGSDFESDSPELLMDELERVSDHLFERLQLADGERLALAEAIRLVPEGVVVSDKHGNVVHQNDHASIWLEDREGQGMISNAVHDVLKVAASGQQNTRSLELLGPPRKSLTISGLPVLNAANEPVGSVAVVEDTSERRHLESLRRDFVANVSHELKTPVGALGLLAETLIVERDPDVVKRLVKRMHVETVRVGQVIDDLLNLSRTESVREGSAQLINVRALLRQALNRVRYTAEYRHIDIKIDCSREVTVYGGQRDLLSAVHHLLENALKYSGDNSVVEIIVTADGDWTEIAVRDHGVGIAAKYLDRIFERFYRVDDARGRSTGGTGLGLAIVRHVVQSHGGEVRVTSQEGQGSTFTLRLAARPSAVTERLLVEGGSDG